MAADPRVPRFELHVQPLMRLLDRDHMRFKLDLWNYEDVKTNADRILELVRDTQLPMPPKSHGGPWPQEWIDLFARWKDAAFPRLERGTAVGGGYTATRSGTLFTLVAKGRVPSSGFTVWLNLERAEPELREYTLVQEPPPVAAPGPERPFTARERFATEAASVTVIVNDRDGQHDVAVTGGSFLHVLGSADRVAGAFAALGGIVTPQTPGDVLESTVTFNGEELRATSDQMFTEVTGTPEALERFGRLLGARARR